MTAPQKTSIFETDEKINPPASSSILHLKTFFDRHCPSILELGVNFMQNLLISSSSNQPFRHSTLYQFWQRSQGIWLSKLVKVTLRLLDDPELQMFQRIHALEQPEFGVKMAWEYQTKSEGGQMMWCVDANHPSLVFTNQGITDESPPTIYQYQMVGDRTLVTTQGEIEERTALDGDSRRLRELRAEGKLVKRLWEIRFSA
jgi:hypothetical protein